MPLSISVRLIASHYVDASHRVDGMQTGTYHYSFDKEEILVGRDQATDVRLPHAAVSLVHLRLQRKDGKWLATDAGSTNGTFLDGRRLEPDEPASVTSGSQLRIGPFQMSLSFWRSPVQQKNLTAPQDTACFARQMVLEVLGASEEGQSHPRLKVINGPEQGQILAVPLHTAPLFVGRGEECHLQLSDADASRRHVEVRRQGDEVIVQDLGSKNGLEINGQPQRGQHALADGDHLRVGSTELLFIDPTERYLKELQGTADSAGEDGDLAKQEGRREIEAMAAAGPAAGPAASGWGAAGTWLLFVLAGLIVLGAVGAMIYLLLL